MPSDGNGKFWFDPTNYINSDGYAYPIKWEDIQPMSLWEEIK